MKKIFTITNKNFVLATPLIIYSLFSSIYMATTMNAKIINLLIMFVLMFLMTAAFVAGWFKMIKQAIVLETEEKPDVLMKEFPTGVGEFFVSSLLALINIFLISALVIFASYHIGMNVIGDLGISAESLMKSFETQESLRIFLISLSPEQLAKINSWNLLLLITMTIGYFIQMFYFPALFFKTKNPYLAILFNLRDLFSRKILVNIGIFLLIFVINFLITLLSTIFSGNVFLHFIVTLLNFYFMTVVAVGIFYYYHENFVKPNIGQNIDIEI